MINKTFKNATSVAVKICKQKKAELRKIVMLEWWGDNSGLFSIEYVTKDCQYHYIEFHVGQKSNEYVVLENTEKEI